MVHTITASQNVKIPGQMDLIPGQMVKFLYNPGKPWMVDRYAIAYKNLNNRNQQVIFQSPSVHVEAFFASLA